MVRGSMKLYSEIEFWGNGVGCFCHEAMTRALHSTFEDVEIDPRDHYLEKLNKFVEHINLNESEECIGHVKNSTWVEFLRNGPLYRFTLPSGTFGYFKRYRIEFNLGKSASSEEKEKIEIFLKNLNLGVIEFEKDDCSHP